MNSGIQMSRILTWGHPNATYTSNDHSKIASDYFIPIKFEEFRDVMTQKYFACDFQLIGTPPGSLQYEDEDMDWVPIESQAEYDEALKYIRQAKSPVNLQISCMVTEKIPCEIKRHLKLMEKEAIGSSCKIYRPGRLAASVVKECPHKSAEKLKSRGATNPPAWFDKYMQKFKQELLSDVKAMLNHEQGSMVPPPCGSKPRVSSVAKPQAPSMDSYVTLSNSFDTEALRVLDPVFQKNLKRSSKGSEKKLKKLNSKLENLELKRTRLLEWNRKRQDQAQVSPISPVMATVMDAAVLDEGEPNLSGQFHVRHNAVFTKKWKILNSGSVAWDDKTEVRLAWLTQGLKPLESIVSCPKLKPGQDGEIAVTFQAPNFAGLFESYWHFYHDDVRFGQWMGCAVIVDPKPKEVIPEKTCVVNNLETVEIKGGNNTNQVKIPVNTESVVSKPITSQDKEEEEEEEDRGEYESDNEEDNNAVSHSDNQSSSDSEDSESFVHVPMPPCYQYQTMPLFSEEDIAVTLATEEEKEKNCTVAPPTHTREPDSEEDEFVEAVNHAGLSTNSTAPLLSQQSDNQYNSTAVQILPDNIVCGAMNVASRAFIGAEAIMKSIQSTTASFNFPSPMGETLMTPESASNCGPDPTLSQSFIVPIWSEFPVPMDPGQRPDSFEHLSSPPIVIPDPNTTSHELRMLYEMGFNDTIYNQRLLTQHNNNIDEVISVLVALSPD